ncbi:MAG: transketolase [Candidatus Riflebacteria bacterium]|nr:transketolase [Candidatus Riflebacteria bacterium]
MFQSNLTGNGRVSDDLPKSIRRIILEQAHRANVGHIGSALSIADIIAVLYGEILNLPSRRDPDRDRFILSKGHAALALYAAFRILGWIDEEKINTYCCDSSLLGVHPEHALPGVDFCSGSLGMGLSIGVGSAVGGKLGNSSRRVFVLLSDAECNEGSVWEAAMFAAHHRLDNLVALIDLNGQQAFGKTKDVLDLHPLNKKWEAFGWHVREVDGHDCQALAQAMGKASAHADKPAVLICQTTFGKGVSFMEGQIPWHYLPMNEQQFAQALREIESGDGQ